MTRLYDRLRVVEDPTLQHEILGDGQYEPVVFEISNVADYYWRHATTSKLYSDIDDFPNVAPPFGCYWMEWRRRPDSLLPVDRVGALILGCDGRVDALPNDARWSVAVMLFMEGRGRRAVRLADWTLCIDEDGSIDVHGEDLSHEWTRLVFPERHRSLPPATEAELSDEDRAALHSLSAAEDRIAELTRQRDEAQAKSDAVLDKARADFAPHMRRFALYPVLLAHSLMACKNVTDEEHDPPERLSKRNQRKRGEPLVRFRTLVITPMGGGARNAERLSLGDGMTALHIVRGHFKTYTADRPLFGKRIGTYWWSPMTRGNAEHGEVVKDYRMASLD